LIEAKCNKKLDILIDQISNYTQKLNAIDFRPYQAENFKKITRSCILNDGANYTLVWARKSGKSKLLKCLFFGLMCLMPALSYTELSDEFDGLKKFRDGFFAIMAGPKLDTASIPFNELRQQAKTKHFRDCLEELNLTIEISNSKHFELSNGSKANAFSGSEASSNEGPGAHLLCIDEASMLTTFSIYKILKPFTAETNGVIVECGTPWKKKGGFLSDIDFNKRHHPERYIEIPYTEVIKYSKSYQNFIDNQLLSLPGGKENPFFRMNFKLEWLIVEKAFVDPTEFRKLATSIRGAMEPGCIMAAGIDWGKVNSDTVCVILSYDQNKASVVDLLCLSRVKYSEQGQLVIDFLSNYKLSTIIPESNNIGDPMSEQIEHKFGKIVHRQNMSTPYQDKIFTNLSLFITSKSKFAWFDDGSREAMDFYIEFTDAEQELKGQFLTVHKPEDVEGTKDDYLFATALALDGALNAKLVNRTYQYRSFEL